MYYLQIAVEPVQALYKLWGHKALFSVSLSYRMKVEMSEMVECRYRYSTCILRLRVDLSECLSMIFKSSEVLLASVVQLMKKGMELYELGIVFLFKGVLGCVCVQSHYVLLPAFR